MELMGEFCLNRPVSKPQRYNMGLRYNTPGLVYGGRLPDGSTIKKHLTMSLTTTEVFGFADKVTEAMDSNSAELLTKGLTVGPWKTEGVGLKQDAVHQADLEGKAKTALKDQTAVTQTSLQTMYDFYSSKLDAMAGAYGKTTTKGKELLHIRSDIRRGPNAPATPPATPHP